MKELTARDIMLNTDESELFYVFDRFSWYINTHRDGEPILPEEIIRATRDVIASAKWAETARVLEDHEFGV